MAKRKYKTVAVSIKNDKCVSIMICKTLDEETIRFLELQALEHETEKDKEKEELYNEISDLKTELETLKEEIKVLKGEE